MKKLATQREHTGDRQLDSMQRDTARVAQRANGCPFITGIMRSVRFTASVAKTVDHGLGARAAFVLARTNYDGTGSPAELNEAGAQSGLDITRQLSVVADVNCLVDLWFYVSASEATPR